MIPIATIYSLPPTEREQNLVRECSGLLTDVARRRMSDDSIARARAYEILRSRLDPESPHYCGHDGAAIKLVHAMEWIASPTAYRRNRHDRECARDLAIAAWCMVVLILAGLIWRLCQ